MDGRHFIAAIKRTVRDSAIDGTLSLLYHPPGRRPSADLLKQSDWYRSLSPQDRDMVSAVIATAVDGALFGLLCVLDGVRAVEGGEIKGDFRLHYIKGGVAVLNGPDAPFLHDLYNDPDV